MEKFAIGLLLGGVGGALLVANNYKMRTLVKKGQDEVMAKVNEFMDGKIKAMEEGVEEIQEKAEEKTESVKRKMRKKTEE
ncbi:MAG: hypothetical protein IKB20_03445 [Clostridia bacterium]|nr:hypothetical protein [Clostridia bacterium]